MNTFPLLKRTAALGLTAVLLFSAFSCGGGSNEGGAPSLGTTPDDTMNGDTGMIYTPNKYAELFSSPTNEYRLYRMNHDAASVFNTAPAQFLNGLSSLRGLGGIVTNIPFGKNGEYLDSPTAFDELNSLVKQLEKKDYGYWLYDEIGYPSGAAGGRTALENESYISQGLVMIKKTGSGKNPITVDCPEELISIHKAYAVDSEGNTLQVNVSPDKVSFNGVSGNWTLYIIANKIFYEGTHAQTNGYGESMWVSHNYINIMNKDAVAEFIDNTYRQYAEKFDYFKNVTGIFTDEPSLMEQYIHTGSKVFEYAQLSWTEGFDEKFEEMHGYSITDKYHLVFEGDSDEARIVRVNYRQTVGEMVSESYFGQIADFCDENGTKSSGHALLEERVVAHAYYYGDLMQCLRKMGIPGVDSLSAKTPAFMHEDWPIFMAIKYATSATTLTGKDRMTMVELCFTDCDGFPMSESNKDVLFKTMNTMAFMGITHFNSYVPLDQLGGKLKAFSDYFGRLSYISRNAKWVGEVGLYYPINTFQAYSKPSHTAVMNTPTYVSSISKTAIQLFENQQDFTVADNEFILEATVENGRIFNDHVSFSVICMPGVEVLPLDVMKKLDQFEKSGGTVIWIDCLPTLADKSSECDELVSMVSGKTVMNYREAGAAVKDAVADKLVIKRETPSLYVGRYVLDDAPMYWLYNSHDMDKSLTLTYEGAKGFDVYDPATGEITSLSGESISVDIAKLHAKLVIVRL